MKSEIKIFVCAVALVGLQAHGQNIVSDSDFSSYSGGVFADWTHSGATGWTSQASFGANVPYAGSSGYAWDEGAVGSDSFQTQMLATTPGTYNISFWILPEGGGGTDYQLGFGGTTLFDIDNMDAGETYVTGSAADVVGGSFTLGQWNEIELTGVATGTLTELDLGIRQDPGYSQLTDVSVSLAQAAYQGCGVPDSGSSMALLSCGLLGLSAVSRRLRWRI